MPRVATLVTLVALCALSAACSDSGDPVADPTTSTSAPTTASTPAEPTESAEPTVEPADGPILDKMTYASVRAPRGWYVPDQLIPQQQEAGHNGSGSIIILAETENLLGRIYSLDELAEVAARPDRFGRSPKVLPSVEIDGVEMYHLAGQVNKVTYLEEFGVANEERLISLHFEFDSEFSPEERQEVVDATMASFRWTDAFQR